MAWSDSNAAPKKKRLRKPQPEELTTKPSKLAFEKTTRTLRVPKLSSLERRMKAIPRQYRATLEAVIRCSKLLPLISPHDLRHTVGALMLRRVPIEVVSKTLGHADISLT